MNPLRLVEDPPPASAEAEPRIGPGAAVARLRRDAGPREAVRDIVRENRLAAGLDPDDARVVLAQRVAESLDGGRAAILTPERRQRALRLARLLGMRPFDASLVVAIVQDNARRGVPSTLLASDRRLVMVAPGNPDRAKQLGAPHAAPDAPRPTIYVRLWLASVVVAGASILAALLSWLLAAR